MFFSTTWRIPGYPLLQFLLIGLVQTPQDTTLCKRLTGNSFRAALCVLAFLFALGHRPRSKSCPWREASALEMSPQSRLSFHFPDLFQQYLGGMGTCTGREKYVITVATDSHLPAPSKYKIACSFWYIPRNAAIHLGNPPGKIFLLFKKQ